MLYKAARTTKEIYGEFGETQTVSQVLIDDDRTQQPFQVHKGVMSFAIDQNLQEQIQWHRHFSSS